MSSDYRHLKLLSLHTVLASRNTDKPSTAATIPALPFTTKNIRSDRVLVVVLVVVLQVDIVISNVLRFTMGRTRDEH